MTVHQQRVITSPPKSHLTPEMAFLMIKAFANGSGKDPKMIRIAQDAIEEAENLGSCAEYRQATYTAFAALCARLGATSALMSFAKRIIISTEAGITVELFCYMLLSILRDPRTIHGEENLAEAVAMYAAANRHIRTETSSYDATAYADDDVRDGDVNGDDTLVSAVNDQTIDRQPPHNDQDDSEEQSKNVASSSSGFSSSPQGSSHASSLPPVECVFWLWQTLQRVGSTPATVALLDSIGLIKWVTICQAAHGDVPQSTTAAENETETETKQNEEHKVDMAREALSVLAHLAPLLDVEPTPDTMRNLVIPIKLTREEIQLSKWGQWARYAGEPFNPGMDDMAVPFQSSKGNVMDKRDILEMPWSTSTSTD
jgi:hypothetical protein